MVRHWCLNGTMVDENRYSSPVPLIGLYTAAATLVCFVLIIIDIWAGFKRKKLWLPCRFFSINSVTLTLVSISTKIPVDLTSPMPSSQDQLCKITGTVFICMCMGFLMPSLGTIQEFESHANLVALSIFVVTVIVNICIQIATGVIYSFIVEHAIILFCMLSLMILLWISAFIVNDSKGGRLGRNKDLISKGIEESLLQRVQVCFLYGYHSSPQLKLCTIPMCGSVSLICIACVVVLGEILLRSLVLQDLKFCEGLSPYEWSMWIVVGTQLLTIVVVCFSLGCRWLTFAQSENFIPGNKRSLPYINIVVPYYMRNTPRGFGLFFRFLYKILVLPCAKVVFKLVISVSRALAWLFQIFRGKHKDEEDRPVKYFKRLLRKHKVRISGWMLKKGVEDMEKWMEFNRRKSPERLRDLLSSSHPLDESLVEEIKIWFDAGARSEVSCLSIVLLKEMAKVSMPSSLVASFMEEIVDEVFHIMHFIDNKINAGSFNSKLKSMTAKILLKGKSDRYSICCPTNRTAQPRSDLAHALEIINKFHTSFDAVVVRDEAHAIVKFIQCQSYSSLDELSDQLKVLFIYMLHSVLSELPNAIFNYMVESPAEEYEERVRNGLKFICQLESLESFVAWSFPIGCNITSMKNAQIPRVDTRSNVLVEGIVDSSIPSVTENRGETRVFREDDIV